MTITLLGDLSLWLAVIALLIAVGAFARAAKAHNLAKEIKEQLLNPDDDSALGRRITAHQVAYRKRVGKIL